MTSQNRLCLAASDVEWPSLVEPSASTDRNFVCLLLDCCGQCGQQMYQAVPSATGVFINLHCVHRACQEVLLLNEMARSEAYRARGQNLQPSDCKEHLQSSSQSFMR